MLNEEWRDIPGFNGKYKASINGEIWSNRAKRVMKQRVNKNGYCDISLWVDNGAKTYLVHRLVALTFYGEPPQDKPQINHINAIRTDNRLENLEYCNCQYNNSCETRMKKISKPVMCIELNIIYPSAMEAMRQTGIRQGTISRVCNKQGNTAGGYHWRYADED